MRRGALTLARARARVLALMLALAFALALALNATAAPDATAASDGTAATAQPAPAATTATTATATVAEAPPATDPEASPAATPRATPASVALARLGDLERDDLAEPFPERQALARTALLMAGPEVVPGIVERLAGGGLRCSIAAWALAEPLSEATIADASAIAALRRVARSGDPDCRLAAISALGRLSVRDAAPEVLAAWRDPFRAPGTDAVALLAVAGVGGDDALAALAEHFSRGGGDAWSVLAIAAALRFGPEAWPMLADAACASADPDVRATASLALLLLAEPRAGCALAECSASETDPRLRRLKYQALGAGGSPSGRALLLHAGAREPDPELRAAAASLALLPLHAPPRDRPLVGSREVREGLDRIAREPVGPQVLADIEAAASLVDLAAIERAMRLLPLRSDRGWHDEHARLGQLRARLLCAADPDCEPRAPTVGRPR